MIRKSIILPVLAFALASLACSINFNFPGRQVKTGPTRTEDINIPFLDADDVGVNLALGVGELTINPGAEDALIDGTITYNVEDFKPDVKVENDRVTIEQGTLTFDGIPSFDEDVENDWDLAFGTNPITLRVNGGAYVGKYELGGLSIKSLYIQDGAADVELSFSEPNLVEMGLLDYQTGASVVKFRQLGNANLSTLLISSGVGSYTLDFSGELQRDANVIIKSGLSTVDIIVPKGVPTEVTFEGGLKNISTSGDWKKSGDIYVQSGEGPKLTITIEMRAGNLELSN